MAKYGIPYKGSKSKIAEEILEQLPSGKRLVDLFGGGFAITHCALMKYADKWESFLYNDINPLLPPLIKDAIAGKYNYDVFTPEWISREEFYKRKDTDGYIKYCWSFGGDGNDYLYGRDKEQYKKMVHELIVFDKKSDFIGGANLSSSGIRDRRLEWKKYVREELNKKDEYKHLENLERLQSLEMLEKVQMVQNLQNLERLQSLEMTSNDYREYEYQEGDVVYCDIPYEDAVNPKDYGGGFDHKAFYEWAKAQPYPVFYSSYTKGKIIWQKEIKSAMSNTNNARRIETLFYI